MDTSLFYADSSQLLGSADLRTAARDEVESSSLIRRAHQGDMDAARALHVGFWPFVREFELAIDHQQLKRHPLQRKFGIQKTSEAFHALAEAVREMKKEEGSHAAHWRKDALCLGLKSLDGPDVSGVGELVATAYTKDLPRFFSVLAGTEFIAEELGTYLGRSSAYKALFSRKRWVWGEVHTIPHDDGPSHLEIDLESLLFGRRCRINQEHGAGHHPLVRKGSTRRRRRARTHTHRGIPESRPTA
jgi:hypothetical protein